MFKKTSGVLALAGLCALSVFFVSCGTSSSRPSGLLYVLSQEQSNVSSFAVDLGSGNLSLIRASAATCPSDASCGQPLQISLDPKGSTAFVLDQGAIVGYTVGSDGSLSAPVAGPTFAAGETAVAMTRNSAGDMLFVATNAPAIYVFSTSSGSTTLTLTSSNVLTRIPTSLSTMTYTPQGGSAQTLLFVTSNQDLHQPPNDNTLSVYVVDSTGNLTKTPDSPYTTQVDPTVVQAINTNAAGQSTVFVYVGNSGTSAGGVSGYQLCTAVDNSNCNQQAVQNHLLLSLGSTSTVGQHPVAILVDPTNAFMYVACRESNQVFAFGIGNNTGKLTALNPASQPTGASPVALALHASTNSSTEYLYSANNGSSSITGWSVVATTGVLGNPINVPFAPGQPSGMAGR
jgi:6-phosphogluconolactonase (cycloisomerase 2 family)